MTAGWQFAFTLYADICLVYLEFYWKNFYRQQQIKSFETSQYKLNYLEVPSGLKMVLNTDPNAEGIADLMWRIYQV